MNRAVLHIVGAALFGVLYVATWTAVHMGSISAPPAGSGPPEFSPEGKRPTHEVRHAPTQRRHLPAPKINLSCPDTLPPAGIPTFASPRLPASPLVAETAATVALSSLHPGRAPPLS